MISVKGLKMHLELSEDSISYFMLGGDGVVDVIVAFLLQWHIGEIVDVSQSLVNSLSRHSFWDQWQYMLHR